MANGDKPVVRCAIYTRKSTDENLDLAFNSLDAQRESAEAYIASQRSEGWVCLPDRYDDGGFSGGHMERPAVKRLLADAEAGKVDCIVVYKVDRLSRSLMDFARIMETLDRHQVSFVSVTQHFNTTSSMGRLTLNILLSFAQFEREIISERTRDKIAATRRKGKWTGGTPMLGYDVDPKGGRLLVNPDEAERVRAMFGLYLERQTLIETIKELDARGWTTKRWQTQTAHMRGGKPFTKSKLHGLLTNVTYLGKMPYRDEVHDGEHPAIVDAPVFEAVQRLLKRNGATGGAPVRNRYGALLRGILRCVPCGCGMVHAYTAHKGRTRYRYYVCQNAQSRGWRNCPTPSVPAAQIEQFVVGEIRAIAQDPGLLAETLGQARVRREKELGELDAELRALVRELERHEAERGKLASAGNGDRTAAERLRYLQERAAVAERRATEVRERIGALKLELVDEDAVREAFSRFDPVWETLTPREQERVIHLLVQRVDYDGPKENVAITFYPAGIAALSRETPKEEDRRCKRV